MAARTISSFEGHPQRIVHGGGRRPKELHPDLVAAPAPNDDLLALDAALAKLADRDLVKRGWSNGVSSRA